MSLLHVSISAAAPEHVAGVLAEILSGSAHPFPPNPGAWIAFAASDDGTAVEVYPLTSRIALGPEQIAFETAAPDAAPTFAHIALASPLTAEAVRAIGAREGWTARVCDRGPFTCIELWIEDRLLIEVLDPAMLAAYRRGMTAENWRRMFGWTD
ncbi:MAG: hypothetical protein AAGE18_08865 [Pseudomonadota bacterium]